MRKLGTTICAALALSALVSIATAAEPLCDQSPFGTNFLKWEFLKNDPDCWNEFRRRIAIMKDAGIHWDRDWLDKKTVNPAPGKWDWEFTDRLFALCREEKISLVVVLMGGKPPVDAAGRAEFAEFVSRTVSRYKSSIGVWEIWNEPNIPSFWDNPDPALYTKLLIECYKAAKKADPNCTILAGVTSGPGADWFEAIHQNGGWGYFDGLSIHPYAMSANPITQNLDLVLRVVNNIAVGHGKPKPVWITEVGWRAKRDAADEKRQAVSLFQTYVISLANGVRNTAQFCMDNYDDWGMIRSSSPFDPKPSFGAIRRLTRALGSPGPAAGFEGYLKMPTGAACYVFRKTGRERVLILWSNDGSAQTVRIPQTRGLKCVDILGRPVPVTSGAIRLADLPVIVSGADSRKIGTVNRAFNPFLRKKGENIAVNGGLERRGATEPLCWHRGRFNSGEPTGVLAVSQEGRKRSECLSISASASNGAWSADIIPIEPGKRYRVSAWVKTRDATGESYAAVYWYGGNQWTWLGELRTRAVSGTAGWALLSATGSAPRNASFLRIHLVSDNNKGTTLFDDVSVREE